MRQLSFAAVRRWCLLADVSIKLFLPLNPILSFETCISLLKASSVQEYTSSKLSNNDQTTIKQIISLDTIKYVKNNLNPKIPIKQIHDESIVKECLFRPNLTDTAP